MKSIYQVKKIEKLAFQALALLHGKSKERSKGQHMTVSKWQNKLKISCLHFTGSLNKFKQAFFCFRPLIKLRAHFHLIYYLRAYHAGQSIVLKAAYPCTAKLNLM